MKTLLLRTVVFCFAIGSLVALSSCGGGGGSSNPSGASGSSGGGTTGTTGATTPNSILSGKYAFSFTGTVTSSGAPIFLAGSFTADGAGNISTGVEDINQVGLSVSKGVAISGTYSIGADGRGTLNITSGVTQTFKIAVENGNHGQLIRFDSGAAGSGSFDLQSSSAFSLSSLSGKFAFEWNGFDSGNESPFSGIGEVSLSSGKRLGGADINDGGNYGQVTATGTFQSPDANGHGTATITYGSTALTYAYDIISANRILLDRIGHHRRHGRRSRSAIRHIHRSRIALWELRISSQSTALGLRHGGPNRRRRSGQHLFKRLRGEQFGFDCLRHVSRQLYLVPHGRRCHRQWPLRPDRHRAIGIRR